MKILQHIFLLSLLSIKKLKLMKKLYTLLLLILLNQLVFSQSYLPLLNIEWKIERVEKNNVNYYPPLTNSFGRFLEEFDNQNNGPFYNLSSGMYNAISGRISWNNNYFNIPAIYMTLGIYEGENEIAVKFFDGLIYSFYAGDYTNSPNVENYYYTYDENSNGKKLIVSRTNGDKIYYSEKALSTSDISKSKIVVYPNPSSDVIKIEKLKPNSSLELTDSSGKLMKAISNIQSDKTEIHIKNLSSGIYYLKINGQSVQKIIKK